MIDAKKQFSESMYRLLKNNQVEKITVDMITEESGLSRSTFYRHFKDKYDLMNFYYQSFLEKIEFGSEPGDWERLIYTVLVFLREHSQYFLNAHKAEGPNSYLAFLHEYSMSTTKKAYMRNSCKSELNEEEEFAITYTCSGSIAVMCSWMAGGMSQDPRNVASIIYNNIPQALKVYLP